MRGLPGNAHYKPAFIGLGRGSSRTFPRVVILWREKWADVGRFLFQGPVYGAVWFCEVISTFVSGLGPRSGRRGGLGSWPVGSGEKFECQG